MSDEQISADVQPADGMDFSCLLAQARGGDSTSMGQLLLAFHQQLLRTSARWFDDALRAKLSPTDLVQDTLLFAVADFAHFRGSTPEEFFQWLMRILQNQMTQQKRRYWGTAKRNLRLELPLEKDDSSPRGKRGVPFHDETPSGAAMSCERDQRLAEAVRRLSETHRRVLRLRHRENLTFPQIALNLNCSAEAARKLWCRAVRQLQDELGEATGTGNAGVIEAGSVAWEPLAGVLGSALDS